MISETGPTVDAIDSEVGHSTTGTHASLNVRELTLTDVADAFRQQWDDLESRALEGNAFLSPNFVIPSHKYLTPDVEILILAVERADSSD